MNGFLEIRAFHEVAPCLGFQINQSVLYRYERFGESDVFKFNHEAAVLFVKGFTSSAGGFFPRKGLGL
ncbi:MAG: hypothetical protein CMJ19_11980, partial [Phycisphaeraceae bacterium]|nr:hypothetical protein [Phycisphaeraceae bacterium]